MRKILHFIIVCISVIPWLVSVLLFALVIQMALLADKVLPDAKSGNCWSFTLPKWHRQGGYLSIRWADGVRFLGRFRIPHAIWVHGFAEDNKLRHTVPKKRTNARWAPFRTAYFDFRDTATERPRKGRA